MGASPSTRRGNIRESPSHTLKLAEKARKIATPPSRGRGDSWIWRPCCGRETHPRRVALSRTWRVATNDTTNENANSPKNRSVKIRLPFRLKQTAFQAKLAEWILRLFFQTRFSYKRRKFVVFGSTKYTSPGLLWANVSGSRMTDMRPWTADVRTFGVVVRIAQVSAVFPLGSLQRPTNANNSVVMQYAVVGYFVFCCCSRRSDSNKSIAS